MKYFIVGIIGISVVIFTLASDGKYFGNIFIKIIYEKFGVQIFNLRSEKHIWKKLYNDLCLTGDEAILDIGTAIGDLPLSIASLNEYKGQLIGIDWSNDMIEHAIEKTKKMNIEDKVSFKKVDIMNEMPFENNSFDVIISLGLVETYSDPKVILEKILGLLKNDGIIVLSLYKTGVKIKYKWYEEYFSSRGFNSFDRRSYRKSMDFLVIRRSNINI